MTTTSSSLLGRLRGLFGAAADDGRLGSSVDAARAVDLVRDGAALLDVRERHEWKTGHAPQAIHVPLGDIDKAPRRLPKDRQVLVVCASGMRSRTAAKRLRGLGIEAASISGGMGAWQRAGGAVRR
ncbi:rhodanese-like domain-containing protein [Georgenia thermotolerans]|uniref:Rhodanese-like domain-containing protein n=1 Tax=Georgenia thermotolerans TaxID=527326 RepID=A0A7J5UP86_9MICO|nr:rhodanese-like domain-containing protein [Georgenia thermotolerans]KAE8764215.1 rhodanese-like domain-containing protein [Georgenia thermotolerans]